MAIGYLVPEFPGQTHAFFWREIEALERLGAEVVPLSTRRPGAHLTPHSWTRQAQARTVYLFPPPLPAAARLPAALARRPRWLRAHLRGRTRQERMQILSALPLAIALRHVAAGRGISHVHVGSCARAALVAALCRELGGPSYSLTLHSALRTFGPLQDLKWRGAAFGTAVSSAVLAELRAEVADLPDRLFVQSMGVDTDKFRRETPYIPWQPGAPFEIFSCGRLTRMKGHENLVEAIGRLRGEGVDARLTIAGEDDAGGRGYRKELEAQITAAGLGDAVTLLGAVDEGVLVSRMQTSHAFALASRVEAIGVAYMEAMACELPTVGTTAGGIPELITDGVDGLLVPPGEPESLTAALRRVTQDGELARRLGAAGRKTVVEGYRATVGAERILAEVEALEGATA